MRRFLLPVLLLAACSKPPAEAPVDPAGAVAPSVAEEPADQKPPEKIDFEAAANTEFQAALKASAPGLDLREGWNQEARALTGRSKPLLALETGTRITAVVMSTGTEEKEVVLGRMRAAKEGLTALQAPPKVLAKVDEVVGDFESGRIEAGELSASLDVLSETIHDGLAEADQQTATLVQAGGWVQGAHLLARALRRKGEAGDGAQLLRQPSLVAHFQLFLRTSDPGRAEDPTVVKVLTSMDELRDIAGQEVIDAAMVERIAALTGDIIRQFE
jgi:hypothetical protein